MARIDVDGERDARVDGAVFEAVRVRGGERKPWPALVLGGAVGALLIAGAVGGSGVAPAGDAHVAVAATSIPVTGGLTAGDPSPSPTHRPRATPGPTRALQDGGTPPRPAAMLELDLRPAGSHLFVHGDVFSIAVTSVSVSLLDPEGRVAAREKVTLPGGSRSFWTNPNPRFDVHFAVPDEMMADGLSIEVAAFDTKGGRLATVREPVTSPVGAF